MQKIVRSASYICTKIADVEIPELNLKDYLYELPEDKIARYPLQKRDSSKLLVYNSGQVTDETFKNIVDYLPAQGTLFFNNTKVIPARLLFSKGTGASIEIFLLQPEEPTPEIAQAMQVQKACTWGCMIRNLKKWKNGEILIKKARYQGVTLEVRAQLLDASAQRVRLEWNLPISFSTMVAHLGEVPLPPYLKRKAETADKETYQTVYSKADGAVAAPTAGLHFTEDVLQQLSQKEIKTEFLTLHVSAGTFQPIKEENISRHPMHSEQIIVTKENLNALRKARHVIAVGTTSLRTLESLYWFGARLILENKKAFFIEKLSPYQWPVDKLPSREVVIDTLLDFMTEEGLEELSGATEVFIFPGYKFKMCDGLVTNFHQPGSTLILLIAAFIGPDWRKMYDHALNNSYRFLSYGDSSLLLP